MKFTAEHIAELNLLLQFDLSSTFTGIKVHQDAASNTQTAVAALYTKGLCTLPDGGYLTNEGIEIAQHAEQILSFLATAPRI